MTYSHIAFTTGLEQEGKYERIFSGVDTDMELLAAELPAGKSLRCVEELVATGHIDWRQAKKLLELRPLDEQELGLIIPEIVGTAAALMRLEETRKEARHWGNYPQKFDIRGFFIDENHSLDMDGVHISKNISVNGDAVFLPSKNGLHTPLALAYAVGYEHLVRDFEPRSMFQKRYHDLMFWRGKHTMEELISGKKLPNYEAMAVEYRDSTSVLVRGGWQAFAAKLYAMQRDAELKTKLYVPLWESMMTDGRKRRGALLFGKIYDEGGLDAALDAAISADSNAALENMAAIAEQRTGLPMFKRPIEIVMAKPPAYELALPRWSDEDFASIAEDIDPDQRLREMERFLADGSIRRADAIEFLARYPITKRETWEVAMGIQADIRRKWGIDPRVTRIKENPAAHDWRMFCYEQPWVGAYVRGGKALMISPERSLHLPLGISYAFGDEVHTPYSAFAKRAWELDKQSIWEGRNFRIHGAGLINFGFPHFIISRGYLCKG